MDCFERIPPVGLINNSCRGCYVNSSVQLLNCMKLFIGYLSEAEPKSELLVRLRLLFIDLINTSFNCVDTFYFLDCFRPENGDPNEFIVQTLEQCGDCPLFQRSLEFEIICQCGKKVNVERNEPFLIIKNDGVNLSLPELIGNSLFQEFHCECQKVNCVCAKILSSPEYLIICVENVKIVGDGFVKQGVSISQHRDISYNNLDYTLQSMITHVNGFNDGHCRCYVNTQKGWFGCDDANVYEWNGILDPNCNEIVTTFLYKKKGLKDSHLVLSQQSILDYYGFIKRKQSHN